MDEEDDNETISRFFADLESLHQAGAGGADHCAAFSETSLLDLQSLLDGHAGRPRHHRRGRAADHDGEDASAALLWEPLAARGLQVSALLRPLSAAMDSSSVPRFSLLAARAYLSLLLCPSAPLYSLFNPISFLSLLRALRRSLKAPNPSPAPGGSSPSDPPPGGRKNARKRKSARVRDAVSSSSPPSAERRTEVIDLLPNALELLDSVLARVRLDASPDALKPLVETLIGIIESTGGHQRLSELCFRILYSVVSRPDHGDQTISSVEVLRALTPMILHSAKSPSRASAVAFVTTKLVPLGCQNDGVRKAVAYLPRFLAMKAPEKSEPRAGAVDSILVIVQAMEQDDQCGFAHYVVKMTQGKAQLRLLAVDLILPLLTSLPNPVVMDRSSEDSWQMECLKALVQRCSDSVGGIRARALTNLGQVVAFLASNQEAHARLREVIGIYNAEFNQLLIKRCQDDKAAVRKATLILIARSTALIGGPIDELLLKTMGRACTDPLVSIRKAAIGALSEVFRRYLDERVLAEWLHAVPRLIVDNETSIQEECENLFLELVVDRISQAVKIRLREDTTELMSILPEGTLDLLKGICDGEVALCIRKICTSLGKKKKLKVSVTSALQNIISVSESLWTRSSMPIEKWVAPPGCWQLLSEVSLFTPKAVEWEFLLHHWQLLDKGNPEDLDEIHDGEEKNSCTWAADRVSLLQTISNVSLELPPEPAAELASNLLEYLKNFNMHFSEVDAHVKALKTLCKRKASRPEEGDALVVKWVHQLLSKALEILDNFVTEVSERGRVSTFLTPPQSIRAKGKKEASSSKLLLQSATAVFTIGSLVLVCPSADLQGIVPLLHTIITSENSEPKPKKLAGLTASFKDVAPSLYIQSWVTMGKICLVDDKLAKRYIPLFVQELERSDIAALRNNLMVIMTDFCVRYTALVDCYIPKITKSLRDSCEVVRRQTFILLSRLLQRDYVKWRGVLFLRFLLSLVDESEKIRHLADFLFESILKAKAPLLAYNSFIEAIFILNDCHAHAAHSNTQESMHGGPRLFSIRGNDEKSRSQRMHIYVSLLKQMAPEHLLATSAKLCAEILAAASDGLLNIDDATGQAVLQDALQILSCKEMRIHPSRASDTNEMDDEGGDGGGSAALAAAKGRVVTQVAKKNLIQIAIPIFIELKRLLESKNSPLTGCLMECLRILLKEFKNEIEEILVGDKQLQKELLYDMQKYEAAKARSTVAETVATVQKSENYRSPNGLSSSVVYTKVSEKLGTGGKIASAVADAAARAKARSVLKEVNQNVPTPPLHTMSVPRLKTAASGDRVGSRDRLSNVLESVRRRQSFESDEDN